MTVRDRLDRLLAILEMARVVADPHLYLGELVEDFVALQRAARAPVLQGLDQVVDSLLGVLSGGLGPSEIEPGEGDAIGRVRWLRVGSVAQGEPRCDPRLLVEHGLDVGDRPGRRGEADPTE